MPAAKSFAISIIGIVLSLLASDRAFAEPPATAASAPSININHSALQKLHWQLACQASTFGEVSFFEMVDQLHALDVHHIELSPDQMLSPDIQVKIRPEMTDEQIDALQAKLNSVKMDVVSYGIVRIQNNSDQLRQLFSFAKKLKLKNVIVNPMNVSLESLDKLAMESSLHVGILIQPDTGWTCDTYLDVIKGRSAFVGLCLDLASMSRGHVALDECVQKLNTHIVEINLTDISDESQPGGPQFKDALNQLKHQNFRGIFAIQAKNAQQWSKSVNAFSAAVGQLP